jgi:maltooligosyltrehalose trehalohydrolase
VDGAVLGDKAFILRYFAGAQSGEGEGDRLLVVNLDAELALDVAPEPLLAPADLDRGWRRLWCSEDPCYGGRGVWQIESKLGAWQLPAESATLLAAD